MSHLRSRAPGLQTVLDAGALMLLSFVVNAFRLGSKSIVLDEAGSVIFARLSPLSLVHAVAGSDPNQSLYYAVLNLWVRGAGESEVAVRLPSAIFGAGAVAVTYLLGRHLFGRNAGIVAGLLLALDAFMVQYAQTARGYSLVVLLVALSSLFFVREIDRPSRRNRIGYVIASALAVYAHYFAVFVPTAHAITLLASNPRAALRREWLGAGAAVCIACLPAAIVAHHTQAINRISWIQPPMPSDIGLVFRDLAGGSGFMLGVLLVAGCAATVLAFRQRRAWPHVFVVAWLIVPMALSYLISLATPMFLSYYLIICAPALFLFGAAGLAKLRPPLAIVAVVALLVGISAAQLSAFYAQESPQNWREATRYVLGGIRPHDGVVYFPDWAHKPFGYYARRYGAEEPANLAGQPLADRERIWFVIRGSDVAGQRARFEQLRAPLTQSFELAERRDFGWVAIELYVR